MTRCWRNYHRLVDAGLFLDFSVGRLSYYLVFYRSKLIPMWLSAWGIGGTVLLMVAAVLVIVGVVGPLSAGQVAPAVPIRVHEMVLAVWLIARGFSRSALVGQQTRPFAVPYRGEPVKGRAQRHLGNPDRLSPGGAHHAKH